MATIKKQPSLGEMLENMDIKTRDSQTPKKKGKIVKFDKKIYFTFGEGDEVTRYRRRTEIEKMNSSNIPFGQLKCCMEVLQFLNLYYNPGKHKKAKLLYIGAALGTNIGVLAKLFPMLEFHLYDSSKFNMRVLKLPNITIYNKLFEEKDEGKWASIAKENPVFLVSDIRNTNYDPFTKNNEKNAKSSLENEDLVWQDMLLQQKWVMAIQPEEASLKCRMPYYFTYVKETAYSYLEGAIYRQVWQRVMSSETRLVPYKPKDGKYSMIMYDSRTYEDLCFHHNMYTRQNIFFANPLAEIDSNIKETDKIAESIGLNNDYDSTCTTIIILDYLAKFDIKVTTEIFYNLAKKIFEGVGDGIVWKYNLYGSRNVIGDKEFRFRYEDGTYKDQSRKKGQEEEDREQIANIEID
jgi:hypothetical protein